MDLFLKRFTERLNLLQNAWLKLYIDMFFTENLLAIEMKNTEILMNRPAHLALSILKLSNIWILVWLCKIKIWQKSKIVLYGYR